MRQDRRILTIDCGLVFATRCGVHFITGVLTAPAPQQRISGLQGRKHDVEEEETLESQTYTEMLLLPRLQAYSSSLGLSGPEIKKVT